MRKPRPGGAASWPTQACLIRGPGAPLRCCYAGPTPPAHASPDERPEGSGGSSPETQEAFVASAPCTDVLPSSTDTAQGPWSWAGQPPAPRMGRRHTRHYGARGTWTARPVSERTEQTLCLCPRVFGAHGSGPATAGELGAPPSPEPLPDLQGKGGGGSVWGPSRTGPAHATAVSFPNVKPQGNFYRENGLERQEESAVRMQAGKWSA